MNVYLIRHGQLDWKDNKKKCIGITDIDLSDQGIETAKKIGEYLKYKNITKIYTSDLMRCKKTAQIISRCLDIPYIMKKELREINMGIWENKTFDYIKKHYADDYNKRIEDIANFKIEDGETFKECFDRSKNILNKICEENKENIAIVSHSGIIKCILCYIKNIPLNDILSIELNYGDIVCIYYN